MLKKFFEFIERNVEGFNFDPRKHSTITVYKQSKCGGYMERKSEHLKRGDLTEVPLA